MSFNVTMWKIMHIDYSNPNLSAFCHFNAIKSITSEKNLDVVITDLSKQSIEVEKKAQKTLA